LLITSKGEPYLSSTNVNAKIIKLPDSTTPGATGTAATPQQNSTYDSGSGADGDLQRLVEIANSLPPRVTSDTVIRLRNKLYGRIAGSVAAVNPYAFSGAGGFREGPLPFIKITGTANSPQDATDITNQTAQAFKRWFEGRQQIDKIKDPVIVEQVNSADRVCERRLEAAPRRRGSPARAARRRRAGARARSPDPVRRAAPGARRRAGRPRARADRTGAGQHRPACARGADDDARRAGRGRRAR
jgi:hypothetical protein